MAGRGLSACLHACSVHSAAHTSFASCLHAGSATCSHANASMQADGAPGVAIRLLSLAVAGGACKQPETCMRCDSSCAAWTRLPGLGRPLTAMCDSPLPRARRGCREKMKAEKLSLEDGAIMRTLVDWPGGFELHIGVGGQAPHALHCTAAARAPPQAVYARGSNGLMATPTPPSHARSPCCLLRTT